METQDDDIGVVRIRVQKSRRGLFMATSPDISGLYVAHRDLNAIFADMPNVIRAWFKRTRGMDVRVFQEQIEHDHGAFNITALTMPAHIAAACVRA
jgi:hypothetical protein